MSGQVFHTFDPVYDARSRILIVGSMASVQSRRAGFYYGNPRNRFYDVLSGLLGVEKPQTTAQKIEMLLQNRIAIYDVLAACEIKGSADSSIKNAAPHDFTPIFRTARIRRVFANGRAAYQYYRKFIDEDVTALPSTSPANAAYKLTRLRSEWSAILDFLNGKG
ncbi:MAG TPA: DNA-deoxyinosine glycosylase [Clostridiales bacterium]|nr:DNA-deoxyinosine glycosylase [Clostridiales bacterium]